MTTRRRLTQTVEPLNVFPRWMVRRDLPEVLAIEAASHAEPWGEEDFLRVLRHRNVIGMVTEAVAPDQPVVGFMVYELLPDSYHLLDLAVSPLHRRRRVGSAMVKKLVSKLPGSKRSHITVDVREESLDAQLFLRACGFRAVAVLRKQQAYRFRWSLPEAD